MCPQSIKPQWIEKPRLATKSRVNRRDFWDNVDTSNRFGCWLWTGSKDGCGYGHFSGQRAHRLAWMTQHGWIPKGKQVLHLCDTPSCVRPEHLRLGSHAENMRDKADRGRAHRLTGEKAGMAKLTWAKVRRIRASYADGVSQTQLARQYGVCQTTISTIIRYKTWVEVQQLNLFDAG